MWGAGDNFGGGFMNSQAPTQAASPAAGGGDKKPRRSQNLMPVAVKQLLDCEEETVLVEGVEAQVVTIVGVVRFVEQSTTKLTVHLDDQTGTMECVNYVGTDSNGATEIPFVPAEGTYVRIVGQLRSTKGVKYLIIFKLAPVTDLNEVTCHILEVIQTPIKLRKLKEEEALVTGVGQGQMNNNLGNSMMMPKGSAAPAGPAGGGAGLHKPGFNQIQNMVFGIIQSVMSEQGIHKDEIFKNVKGKISQKELEKVLEDLGNEGHIYSTVDEDHFKTTD